MLLKGKQKSKKQKIFVKLIWQGINILIVFEVRLFLFFCLLCLKGTQLIILSQKQMGNQNNLGNGGQSISLDLYQPLKQYQLPWTGNFTLLQSNSQSRHKKIIEKKLRLYNGAEAKELIQRFKTQMQAHFYLVKPLHIELGEKDIICAQSSSVTVYHADLLPTLQQRMQENDSNLGKEVTIWFLLNEVVHGLEMLYDKNIMHLWVSPETIFQNQNANWMLQDMSFWWGYDVQSLLQRKLTAKNQIMSPQLKALALSKHFIDLEITKDQDVYCLGYTIFFVMTSIPFAVLSEVSHEILKNCRASYSDKLVSLVSEMIDPQPRKRISFQRLKLKLKIDEEQIINSEIKQYQKSHSGGGRMSEMTIFQQQQSSFSQLNSPVPNKRNRFQADQRTQARTQFFYSPMTDRSKLFTSPQPNRELRRGKPVNIKHFKLGSTPIKKSP